MPDVIPVRSRRGRKKHATPQTGDRDRTLCGRPANGLIVDDGFPDCARCCRRIAELGAEVVR